MKIGLKVLLVFALLFVGCQMPVGELENSNIVEPTFTPNLTPSPTEFITPEIKGTHDLLEIDNIDRMTIVLEASLNAESGEINGWGWKPEYGYYEVNQDHITDPNEPGYGFLTLWIELDDGTLSPVEEHISNGHIIYPVNESWECQGTIFVPFYCDFVKEPNRGLDHENGVYWLDSKYLEYYPIN